MRSDEELMSAVAEGDLTAFEQLVRRHQSTAWNAAFRLVGDVHAAEDIAQEAFLRVLHAAPRYRPTAAFRTYLYRIVTRLCRDHRRRIVASPSGEVDAWPSQAPLPEDIASSQDLHSSVNKALAALPARQREAVVLRYYEGLNYTEIGHVIGATRKGVERLLARGRAALAGKLSVLLEE
jgi:RNA polymerase sigma-70 factor, ECF subfamily